MEEKFVYDINKRTLTIRKCPMNMLRCDLIDDIIQDNFIENVIVCEGIEIISEKSFINCRDIKKVVLPSSLVTIEKQAFKKCDKLKSIQLPTTLKEIKKEAFKGCLSLKKINIPSNVKIVEQSAFENCSRLNIVNIEDGVEVLESQCFSGCSNLRKINIPSSVSYIGSECFESCSTLKSIEIPEGIEELEGTFASCEKLKQVFLPSTLKVINEDTFNNCSNLGKINLPENLEIIGERAFYQTGLWKIDIPGSVKKIELAAFKYCDNLFDVRFNDGLKKIEENAFYGCYNLTEISLPDSLEIMETGAFSGCSNVINVDLAKNLKSLNNDVLSSCFKLRNIEIPEGVEYVSLGAFNRCYKLEEIHFPSTIKRVSKLSVDMVLNPLKLRKIYITCKDEKKEIDVTSKRFCSNTDEKLFFYDSQKEKYSFYNDGEYIEFDESLLKENPKISKMIKEGYIHEKEYINLYYWCNRKIIPSPAVIKTMPIKDIDKFFANKNYYQWVKLVKESNVEKTYEGITSFFKLCYVLGVFNESTTIRDKAVSFIRNNIIGKLSGYAIHSKFDGFALENGFNKEYAEFFMKYYSCTNDFLITIDERDDEVDLTCASYNNFKQVKRIYPNKTLNTNRRADLLLPEHVINAVSIIEYDNVDDDNEEFSFIVGKYGYTQEQFELLQEWYNKGKKIKNSDMKLFVCKDSEEEGITYSLLSKDDPRNAILGNITNCCQIVGGAGEECVEYGMTKANSGFIIFNYKDKIIGQSWVWYDEKKKTICLDNIEIPHRYLEKINQNKIIQKNFIECLLRIENNFKEKMKKHGLEVNKVTIGKGYNDIKEILNQKFLLIKESSCLTDYGGYSDASSQYLIKKR